MLTIRCSPPPSPRLVESQTDCLTRQLECRKVAFEVGVSVKKKRVHKEGINNLSPTSTIWSYRKCPYIQDLGILL